MSSKAILEAASRSLSPTQGLRTHEELLRLRAVKARTGRSKTALYTDPTFPRPIKLSSKASAWLASEVDAWIAMRIKASRPDPGPVDSEQAAS